jgi:post-segregation antitoxin (ccd killing protein)
MGKERITIEVDADWAAQLRAKGVDVARHVEKLVNPTPSAASTWAEDNAEAIKAYNKRFENDTIWSDGLRRF